MTSPQGMDELFWGRDHEDVNDWAERLSMAAEVRDLNADKLFKIAKLNLRGRAREWFRRLESALADWLELKTLIVQKYGTMDADDIRVKLDAIKQEPRERVQKYFERLDRLFQRGRIPDTEQRRRFLARLKPEIRKLCIVRTFADIEELVGAATELKRVLGKLGETPFEPLKEEQEEEVVETIMEKQVAALNNALVSFFKRNVPKPVTSSSSTMFGRCQICKGGDHIATACPRLNEPRPKCAGCGMPHRIENCGMKCSFCSGLGHSKDRCWKKSKDGKVHPGSANFLEVLLNNEEVTMQQLNRLCVNENIFSHTRAPRRRMPVEVVTGGAVPSPEVAEGVTVHQGLGVDEKHQETRITRMAVSDAILVGEAENGTRSTDGMLRSGVEDMNEQLKEKLDNVEGLEMECLTEEDPGILEEEKSPKLGLFLNTLASSEDREMVDVDDTTETRNASLKVEELFPNVLPPSAVEDDLVNQGMIVSCTDEQQTFVTQLASKMVDVFVEVSQQEDPSSRTEYGMEIRGNDSMGEVVRMQLPDSFVAPEDSSIVSIQVSCQASPKPYYIDSSMQSPEVMMGTVVGELNSVNKVASLSSNNSEQEMGTMPFKQHSIALNQDLVTEVSRKGDDTTTWSMPGTSILFWMQKWWKLAVMVMFQIALILENSNINSVSHWNRKWKCISLILNRQKL